MTDARQVTEPVPPRRPRPAPSHPLPRILDDDWEAPPSNRGRGRVVAACIGVALIVTGVALLSSGARVWQSDDGRIWGPIAPAPSSIAEASGGGPTTHPRSRVAPAANRLAGYLSVNSSPWAALSVDGRVVGTTPQVRIRVTPGRHHLLLVRVGFQTHSTWVSVPAGGTVRLTDITLAAITR